MDETSILEPDCSSRPFENELGTIDQAATFDSILTRTALGEVEDWSSNWQQNGFYISDNSSSEPSLSQNPSAVCPGSPVGSNSSWTEEDDTGSLFFEIEQRLRSFILADDQTDLTIPPLNSQQRRVVHGMAHLMHLGHQSFKNDGKLCRMYIFKRTNSVPSMSKLPNGIGAEDFGHDQSDYWKLPLLESTQSLAAKLQGNVGLLRRFEYRLRLPKRESGFPFRFPPKDV